MSSVKLYIYDLSRGLARSLAPMLIGRNLDGVWHSSLVVHGKELYYGQGVFAVPPGTTHLGPPQQVIELGQTEVPWELIEEYIEATKEDWTAAKYHLFTHNCNDFSEELAQFLVGSGIPAHIKDVARLVANTPFGQMLVAQLMADGSNGAELGAVKS